MNIDSILTEWCYRLPKGYPTVTRDYEVLYNVLLETCNVTPEHARQIVEHAKNNKQHLLESNNLSDLSVVTNNSVLRAALTRWNEQHSNVTSSNPDVLYSTDYDHDRAEDLREFLTKLPVEADEITKKLLQNLNYDLADEFVNMLYSYDSINENILNSINLNAGISKELFNLKPDGMGKGEILLAAMFKGAEAQGGTTSYDLLFNGKQYELKDYSNPKKKNASIRLGTKGNVTRFRFWDEITATLKRIDQLRGIDKPKFDLDNLLDQPLMDAISYLTSRKEFILAGNLNLTDKLWVDRFYQEANKINSNVQGYTNIILRGPNAEPIEMSIEPINSPEGTSFTIHPIRDESRNLMYINTELRRLKYVRNPELLDVDMQDAVNKIVGDDLTFIIFRYNHINITRDFKYAVVDAGKIRIIEQTVFPIDITDEEDMN